MILRALKSHISQIAQSFLSKNVTFLRSGNHANFIRVTLKHAKNISVLFQ